LVGLDAVASRLPTASPRVRPDPSLTRQWLVTVVGTSAAGMSTVSDPSDWVETWA
jgi:hypothetical protein